MNIVYFRIDTFVLIVHTTSIVNPSHLRMDRISMEQRTSVAEKRRYIVRDVSQAKQIASNWLRKHSLDQATNFGLPEVDDRYHVWRVPLLDRSVQRARIGEVVIDAYSSLVAVDKTTDPSTIENRLLGRTDSVDTLDLQKPPTVLQSEIRNIIALGDSSVVLRDLPAQSVGLVFTSPPYFNARPEYTDYHTYEHYLLKVQDVIAACHRVLAEGRFLVVNSSPILVRRTSRSQSSKRLAVPFDLHQMIVDVGFDFIDDVIWQKPNGAGWATGRGRRFAADRQPLQYKAVPVTEYVMVYRKHTEKLIDWNIRQHPNQQLVKDSIIEDDYEKTNVWQIKPTHDQRHPAVFPVELAEKVIRYYSFKGDSVLDPFAGIGTVGKAAIRLERRFILVDNEPQYVKVMQEEAVRWLGQSAEHVLCLNCPPIDCRGILT